MKYNIGNIIKDEKRNITITDVKRENGRIKYKYKCNICGYNCGESYKDGIYQKEYWIDSTHLHNGVGCSCCQGRAVVTGINNIGFTHPHLAIHLKNDEDKNKYTYSAKRKVELICPTCHLTKFSTLSNLSSVGFICPHCSDKLPYGEKIMCSLLYELGVDFIKEYSSGNSDWTESYRYDFYIAPDTIIEIMGIQHKQGSFYYLNGRTTQDEQNNDRNKKNLAFRNGIKNYIVIDSDVSDFDYIKNNILNSKLSEIFNLNNVDWNKIYENSLKSIVKDICDYWNSDSNITTTDIANKFGFSNYVVINYLKQGAILGWCDFDRNSYRHRDSYLNDAPNHSNPIKCIENNTYFKSIGLCVRLSKNIFGIQLNQSCIRDVLRKKNNNHRNYHFIYISKNDFNKGIEEGLKCYGSPFKMN